MPTLPQRTSHRLKGYDYREANGYFVTLVTYQREPLFGKLKDDQVILNSYGTLVKECWERLPMHCPILLDEMIIMPDHLHGLFFITQEPRKEAGAPKSETLPASLGTIIQAFKTVTTTRINRMRRTLGQPVWQRNYYDHIVRCEQDYQNVVRYIAENPWRHNLDLDTE